MSQANVVLTLVDRSDKPISKPIATLGASLLVAVEGAMGRFKCYAMRCWHRGNRALLHSWVLGTVHDAHIFGFPESSGMDLRHRYRTIAEENLDTLSTDQS